ncbi:hypothetical protein [Negadavirga shengliensis]|uniref:Uncharacterized protein n=1 Tax=Negadavirga shengliensis TaxID=1389218 RepID=A0ABV9T7H0_9BACT
MKKSTKLIVANLFALVAVGVILGATTGLGIDLKGGSEAIVAKVLLVCLPQAGFVYLLLKSLRLENQKVPA